MWTYQNGKLEKDGQSLPVSPELKLVEGGEYRENVDFRIEKPFLYCQTDIENDDRCEEQCDHCAEYYKPLEPPLAIPIEPQSQMTAEEVYNAVTLKHLGNNPQGTRMDIILAAMEEYASLSSVKEVDQGIAMTGDFKKEDVLLPHSLVGNSIEQVVELFHEWQIQTFPGATPISKLKHLSKEVDELIEEISGGNIERIKKEYADCFALLFGSAYAYGLRMDSIVEAMTDKLKINKKRKWGTPDKDGVVYHIKDISENKNDL